ncbi:MAG: hypothetical protein BA864_08130 [Desulfuromonadales bacterium C00003093]|nr:MAG: hypothetical protein BA864_08130 [Desulfuromonadales bacterium C00003093]
MEQEQEIVSYPGQASGSGENISSGAGSGSGSQQVSSENGQGFMTEAAMDTKMEAFAKELQSRTDKAVSSVSEKVNAILNSDKDLIASGVELTDAQKSQIQAAKNAQIAELVKDSGGGDLVVANDQLVTPKPTEKLTETSDAESATGGKVDPLAVLATEIMDKAGARIYKNDPEAKILEASNDKVEYLANSKVAAEAKVARLNRDPASLGTGGGAGGPGSVMDQTNSQTWEEASKEI